MSFFTFCVDMTPPLRKIPYLLGIPPGTTTSYALLDGLIAPHSNDVASERSDSASVRGGVRAASASAMDETRYGLRVELPVAYERAVELATAALKAEGFGVLTTIDVQQTLKQKLDRTFRKYVILGACNPPLADRALHAELEIGLLLPCNVIVYETSTGRSAVSAMAPMAALAIVGENPDLRAVASEADARLRRALGSLEAESRS